MFESLDVETEVKLDQFKWRDYQLPLLDALENKKYKRALAIFPRRAGKDLVAFNYVIRCAIRKVGVYFILYPTYSQGRKTLWDSMTNDGIRFLDFIPPELIESTNATEMKIRLKNQSLIQVVGSDDPDRLVGTNAIGMVFSEYALQDPRGYQLLRPILTANDGWALFISCVSPDTLVVTENGLSRISSLSSSREEYSDFNKNIFGLGGFHNATDFYYGGKQKTLVITLFSGYRIECTPVHKLWTGSEWKPSSEFKVGDLLPVQYGQEIWGKGLEFPEISLKRDCFSKWDLDNRGPDEAFFYLLGLIHADGSYDKNKVTITKKKDQQVIDFLHDYGFSTYKDKIHHHLNSRVFCLFLEWLDFKHGARKKTFSDKLFQLSKPQMRFFLQGLFDGDGTSNSSPAKCGAIKLTSTCLTFLRDLQVVLLNFGIVSSIHSEFKNPTQRVKVSSIIHNLEICGFFAYKFYTEIGFRLERKQKNFAYVGKNTKQDSGNIYPVDISRLNVYKLYASEVSNPSRISRRKISKLNSRNPHPYLSELLNEKLFYSPIKSIEESESEVFDFVIPDTHSFFSNGFISHNTPRGHNHCYELYQIAMANPKNWFCSKLSVIDTGHISLEAIEREKQSGEMSEDLIQQEYYCSFDLGIEGSYYSRYIDKMRLKGQIGIVPFESGFKVFSSWDIGVRDSTTIIFYQSIGTTVRIIDCYENSKVGLEHYIKILNEKSSELGYIYGRHFAPHDIAVKEWGTGMTRIEKAKQLGVTFTLVPNISIEDGIEACRSSFSKVWMDEVRCKPLIKALENYRQEYDIKKKVYKTTALHDWSSHFADAYRYLIISLPKTRDGLSAEDLNRRYQEAMYGDQGSLPAMFRDDMPKY